MNEVILKRFEQPDEIVEFEKGKFETVRIGELVIGRATYQPGWKWSEHVGLVPSGTATAAFDDGTVFELRAGELFYIPPIPHDSWVVGDQPYVSLHFSEADRYARAKT
jgi:quercetin dioxygenase-like cupin family protein